MRDIQYGCTVPTWKSNQMRLPSSAGIIFLKKIMADLKFSVTCQNAHVPMSLVIAFVVGVILAPLVCGLSDCDSLATTGWGPIAGWIVNSTNSSWCCSGSQNGITCDVKGTRVTQLSLVQMQLTGMVLRPASTENKSSLY